MRMRMRMRQRIFLNIYNNNIRLVTLQSIPPTTANKQTQAQKKGGAGLESCQELKLKATG